MYQTSCISLPTPNLWINPTDWRLSGQFWHILVTYMHVYIYVYILWPSGPHIVDVKLKSIPTSLPMPTPNKPVLHCVVGDGSQQPKAVGFALAEKTTEFSTDYIIIVNYFSVVNSVSRSNFMHLVLNESGALLPPCSLITTPNPRSGRLLVCRDDSILWPLVSRCKCYDWNILAYFGLPHWCVLVILYVGDNSPWFCHGGSEHWAVYSPARSLTAVKLGLSWCFFPIV